MNEQSDQLGFYTYSSNDIGNSKSRCPVKIREAEKVAAF